MSPQTPSPRAPRMPFYSNILDTGRRICSDSRVTLGIRIFGREIVIPSCALLVQGIDVGLFERRAVIVQTLKECIAQPSSNMPRDMTMHTWEKISLESISRRQRPPGPKRRIYSQPGARIVRLESEEQPALGGKHGNITPYRVISAN